MLCLSTVLRYTASPDAMLVMEHTKSERINKTLIFFVRMMFDVEYKKVYTLFKVKISDFIKRH